MVFEKGDAESEALIEACEPPRRLALSTKGPYGVNLEITLVRVRAEGEGEGDGGAPWKR